MNTIRWILALAMALAAAARAEPPRIDARGRNSLDAPKRVVIGITNTTTGTQTVSLLWFGGRQAPETLVDQAVFAPGERRQFVFPTDPLAALLPILWGRQGFQVFCGKTVREAGLNSNAGTPVFGVRTLDYPGYSLFLPPRVFSEGPAVFSPLVDRRFLENYDSYLDAEYANPTRGNPSNPSFEYEYAYDLVKAPPRPSGYAYGYGYPPVPSADRDAFVVSPDDSPFPDDPARLTWLDAIFLDGGAVGAWSAQQKQALEIWVARGGLLFLDPLALNALGGMALVRGARADLSRLRTIDLAPVRPKRIAPPMPPPPSGPSKPPASKPVATPRPQPVAQGKPAPVSAAAIEIPGVGDDGALAKGSPPGFFVLGKDLAFSSWAFGGGRVAVQAFQGAGDPKTMERWLHIQRLLRPANAIPGVLWSTPSTLRMAVDWQDAPLPSGLSLGQTILWSLRTRFHSSRTACGVAIAMGLLVAVALGLFFVVRVSEHGRFRRVILLQAVALSLAAAGVYWAGTRHGARARVGEALFVFPDSPWVMRQITLAVLADGACRVSAELARDAPLRLVALDEFLREGPESGECNPLPLFPPPAPQPRHLWNPMKRMAYGEAKAGYASLVEHNDSPGLVVELRGTTTGTLTGTIRNESPFVLGAGALVRKWPNVPYVTVVCLPAEFPPGARMDVPPVTLPPLARARGPALAPAPKPSSYGYGSYGYVGPPPGRSRTQAFAQPGIEAYVENLIAQGTAFGKSFALEQPVYQNILQNRMRTGGRSFVLPRWSEIPESGLIVGWIVEKTPPALDDLFRVTPAPRTVEWQRLYVQLLK